MPPEPEPVDPRVRVLLMTVRQALIMVLGALEDFLEMERSIVPRHLRELSN
jgi:hypothetical protein